MSRVVVVRIFELCAAGAGYTRIAKLLNDERAPAPRPQQRRAWSPSTVNEILHRPIYHGEIVWNRTQKRDRWGKHDQSARPTDEWFKKGFDPL